jgi:hypothetical protein
VQFHCDTVILISYIILHWCCCFWYMWCLLFLSCSKCSNIQLLHRQDGLLFCYSYFTFYHYKSKIRCTALWLTNYIYYKICFFFRLTQLCETAVVSWNLQTFWINNVMSLCLRNDSIFFRKDKHKFIPLKKKCRAC